MKDLDAHLSVVEGINSIAMTVGVGAKNTGNQDLQGYMGAVIALDVGAKHASDTLSGTNKITVLLEHADDDGTGSPGTYAAVAAADVRGVTPSSGVLLVIDHVDDTAQVYQWGYIGAKRFIRATLTPEGTIANGVPVCVMVIKGFPNTVPTP